MVKGGENMKEQNAWVVAAVVVIVALVAGYVGYVIAVGGLPELQPVPPQPGTVSVSGTFVWSSTE